MAQAHFLEVNRSLGAVASCKSGSRDRAGCAHLTWVSLSQHPGLPPPAISAHAVKFLGQIAHVSAARSAEASGPHGKAPFGSLLPVAFKFECASAVPSHVSSFPVPRCRVQGGRGYLGSQCEIKTTIAELCPAKQHQTQSLHLQGYVKSGV